MDDLNREYDEAKKRLDKLSNSTQDAWMDLREGVDNAVDEIKQSVDSATSRISS
jgi:hypothetical protein